MPDVPRGPRRALKGLEIDPRSGSHGHGVRRLDARHAGALHRGALDLPEHLGGCRAPEESSALAESALFRGLPRIPRQELSERKAFLVEALLAALATLPNGVAGHVWPHECSKLRSKLKRPCFRRSPC